MPQPVRIVLAIVLVGSLATFWIWSRVSKHPERRPYGKRYLLRTSPFVALLAGGLVYGLVANAWNYVIWSLLGLMAFGSEIRRRWRPPTSTG